MAQLIDLQQKDLADLARTYGHIYDTLIGQVAYTKLTDPEGFVLLAKDDTLRFYMFRKLIEPAVLEGGEVADVPAKYGVWELVWGASSIAQAGLPTAEELIQWRLKHALNAGKQGLDSADALGKSALNAAASTGTAAHRAAEDLLNMKSVLLAGRDKREVEHITSLCNFLNDYKWRNAQNEQIVAYDKTMPDGTRITYAGTVDLVIEIYNDKLEKWETWLIDFKTSADVHLTHKIQVVGYKEAAEQSLGMKIDRVGILLLGRRTVAGYKLEEVGRETYRVGFDKFELAYRMVLLVNKGKMPAPSYKTYPKSIKITPEEEQSNDNNSNAGDSSGNNAGSGGATGTPKKQSGKVKKPTDKVRSTTSV